MILFWDTGRDHVGYHLSGVSQLPFTSHTHHWKPMDGTTISQYPLSRLRTIRTMCYRWKQECILFGKGVVAKMAVLQLTASARKQANTLVQFLYRRVGWTNLPVQTISPSANISNDDLESTGSESSSDNEDIDHDRPVKDIMNEVFRDFDLVETLAKHLHKMMMKWILFDLFHIQQTFYLATLALLFQLKLLVF